MSAFPNRLQKIKTKKWHKSDAKDYIVATSSTGDKFAIILYFGLMNPGSRTGIIFVASKNIFDNISNELLADFCINVYINTAY